jgi:hypothetical protein
MFFSAGEFMLASVNSETYYPCMIWKKSQYFPDHTDPVNVPITYSSLNGHPCFNGEQDDAQMQIQASSSLGKALILLVLRSAPLTLKRGSVHLCCGVCREHPKKARIAENLSQNVSESEAFTVKKSMAKKICG